MGGQEIHWDSTRSAYTLDEPSRRFRGAIVVRHLVSHEQIQNNRRSGPFERSAHWANAIAFCTLAISGICMAWGKFFLLPVVGKVVFGYLTYLLQEMRMTLRTAPLIAARSWRSRRRA